MSARMSVTKKCVGKESFQRMNYLYQLSNHLVAESQACHTASAQYSNLAINISKKAVQRLDTEVKRTLCKGCRVILIPGVTCKVRIKKKKVIKRCLKCAASKVFDTRYKSYVPWSQRNESLLELLDYTPDKDAHTTNKSKNNSK